MADFRIVYTKMSNPNKVVRANFSADSYNKYRAKVSSYLSKDWKVYHVYYGGRIIEGSSVPIRDKTFNDIFPSSRPKK